MTKASNATPQDFPTQIDRSLFQKYNYTLVFDRVTDAVFYLQEFRVPTVSLQPIKMPSMSNDPPIPGDKLDFEEQFTLPFALDENLRSYAALYRWLFGIRSPKSTDEHKEVRDCYSDARLFLRGGNGQEIGHYQFVDCFPTSLPGPEMKSTEQTNEPIQIVATFAYSYFEFFLPGEPALPTPIVTTPM